jgi:hypothetical protein
MVIDDSICTSDHGVLVAALAVAPGRSSTSGTGSEPGHARSAPSGSGWRHRGRRQEGRGGAGRAEESSCRLPRGGGLFFPGTLARATQDEVAVAVLGGSRPSRLLETTRGRFRMAMHIVNTIYIKHQYKSE